MEDFTGLKELATSPSSDSQSELYAYQPLSGDDIRVVHILPAEHFHSPLECSIRHRPIVDEDKFNPYLTLSYAWGDTFEDGSHLSRIISCEGKAIAITAVLEQALRYVRLHLDKRNAENDCGLLSALFAEPRHAVRPPIWIDALCINQSNAEERNHQVRRMADIYSRSSRLLIWLGADGDPTNSFMTRVTEEQDMVDEWDSARIHWSIVQRSPWFRRRWVIQEYALTPIHSRYVIHGPTLSTAWEFLSKATRALSNPLLEQNFATITGTDDLVDVAYGSGPMSIDSFGSDASNSLLYHLCRFDKSICSTPHDLVYSLLALSKTSPEIAKIEVDYAKSVEDCFIEVALSIIMAGNMGRDRLGVLLAVAAAKRGGGRMPSWVPDWRRRTVFRVPDHQRCAISLVRELRFERPEPFNVWQRLHYISETASDGGLRIKGKLLAPCFPPKHKACGILHGQTQSLPVDHIVCWTCEVFAQPWQGFCQTTMNALREAGVAHMVAFILPCTPAVFILNKTSEDLSSVRSVEGSYEVVFCLDPRYSVSPEGLPSAVRSLGNSMGRSFQSYGNYHNSLSWYWLEELWGDELDEINLR